jgi:hypothetical protein
MPALAPVMTATLFCNLPVILIFLLQVNFKLEILTRVDHALFHFNIQTP